MNPEILEKRLARAQSKAKTLEKLIEDKTRELFLAQQEVEITSEYLQNILKSMTSCLVVVDPEGDIKTVNRATLGLLGYEMEELIGTSFEAIYGAGGGDESGGLLESQTDVETSLTAKDGQAIPVLLSSSQMHDADEVTGTVCIAVDISERKKAEEALKITEAKFRAIFEHSVDGIFQTSLDGRYISANTALARIHGYETAEELTTCVADIGKSVYVESGRREQFRVMMEDQGRVSNFESQIVRKDGSLRWISESARLVRDDEGKPQYYEGTIEDVTERKKAEGALRLSTAELEQANHQLKENQAQLLQSEKMASVGQLAAGVAHEINNPMGFISGNLGTMRDYVSDLKELLDSYKQLEESVTGKELDKAQTAVEEIAKKKEELDMEFLLEDVDNLVSESRDGAERVRKIVQNLKEFSHVDKEEKMPANLNDGVESTLNIVWNEIKHIATVEKEYGDIPEVRCHPMELNQVFMNMLVNAAQAMEKEGTITIRTFQDDGFVCVSIADTGKGMPPEVVEKVFDPFFTTKEVGEGTGLGLNMAYNIVVNKHNGEILVDSKEGTGTIFTVKIPL